MATLADLAKKAGHAASMLVAVGRAALATREQNRNPSQPIPKAEVRDYTLAEFATFDGSDPLRPILLAIRGTVYDVTRGKSFYGPGGPYALFAGRECARAFALDSLEASDLTGDLEGLTAANLSRLDDWTDNFESKYGAIGRITPIA